MKKRKTARQPRERFVKLSSTGRELSIRAKNWPLVLDRETKLIWTAEPVLSDRANWGKAICAADAARYMGRKFHAPSIKEQFSIVDHTKRGPAVDTRFFRLPAQWFWTSTPLAGFEESLAWFVYFSHGGAGGNAQDREAFVLAVCSARASQ
jgi:hypothetical protein